MFGLNKLMLGPKMIMPIVVKFVFYYRGGSLRLKVYDLRGLGDKMFEYFSIPGQEKIQRG